MGCFFSRNKHVPFTPYNDEDESDEGLYVELHSDIEFSSNPLYSHIQAQTYDNDDTEPYIV